MVSQVFVASGVKMDAAQRPEVPTIMSKRDRMRRLASRQPLAVSAGIHRRHDRRNAMNRSSPVRLIPTFVKSASVCKPRARELQMGCILAANVVPS